MELQQVRGADEAFLSWNDLQATVNRVNTQVQEETDREYGVGLEEDSPLATMSLARRL